MSETVGVVSETAAPSDRPRRTIDVREVPPPEPLTRTLEQVADLDDETVLVQLNDRKPQHLYPKLTDRGYEYDTVVTDEFVATVVWHDR